MPTVQSRGLIHLVAIAFLLLHGSGKNEQARLHEQLDRGTTAVVSAANLGVVLPSTLAGEVTTAPPLLPAFGANVPAPRIQSVPARICDRRCLRSCERTTTEAARPPPLQA